MHPMIPNKKWIRECISILASKQDYHGEVFCGLVGNELKKANEQGGDYVYLDHSYFKRGWANQHLRICRNWVHQTKTFPRPDDRLKKFEVQIKPWRKTGRKVAVIPNTVYQYQALGGEHWVRDTVKRLKEVTDRPVEVREKGHGVPFVEYLQDVWAVVTWGSVAGVEAAINGIPVFAEPTCPAHPISAGPLDKIDAPEYADNRHEWACSLSYASWHWSEIESINFKDYWYDQREPL